MDMTNAPKNSGSVTRVVLVLLAGYLLLNVTAFVWIHESGSRLPRPPGSWKATVLDTLQHPALRPIVRRSLQALESRPEMFHRLTASLESPAFRPTGVAASESSVLTFPQTVNGVTGGFRVTTLIVVINNGGANAAGTIILRQDDGTPMEVQTNLGRGSRFDFELEAGAVLRLETDGGGDLVQGWTEVISDVPLSGSGAFTTFSAAGDFLSSAGIGDSVRATRLMLFVDTTEDKETGLAMCNPGNGTVANYTLTLKDLDGNTVDMATGSLADLQQFALFVPQAFPEAQLDDFKGVLIVESDVPVAVVTLRTRGVNFTSLPAVPVAVEDPDVDEYELHFARIGDGLFGDLSFVTSLILLNNSDQDVAATVEFFDQNGSELALSVNGSNGQTFEVLVPAGCGREMVTDGAASPGVVGWARVTSARPLQGGGAFTISRQPSGAFVSEVGVPSSVLTPRPSIFVRELSRTTTGVALTNPGELAATVRIRLIGRVASALAPAGEAPAPPTIFEEQFFELPPFAHVGRFVSELFPEVAAIQNRDFEGRLEIDVYSADFGEAFGVPVSGLTLLSDGNILTSLPLSGYVINSGPILRFQASTLLEGSQPAFCLNLKQLTGEVPFRQAEITLDQGHFHLSGLSDAARIGDSVSSLFFLLVIGRTFATQIEEDALTFYSPLTFDGASDSIPYEGRITNLPGGGIHFQIDNNSSSVEPFLLTSIAEICFGAGLLQLPDGAGTPVNIVEEYRSENREDGTFYETTRRWQVRTEGLEAPAPRVDQVSERRVAADQQVTVRGSGFDQQSMVFVEGQSRAQAEVLQAESEELVVRLPFGTQSGPLTVRSGNLESNSYQLENIFSPIPQVNLGDASGGSETTLQAALTQAQGEITFRVLEIAPQTGDWITAGFSPGDVIGSLETRSALSTGMLELRVTSSTGERLELEVLESGQDPQFTIEISSGGSLLMAPAQDGFTFEIPIETLFDLRFTQPVFTVPAAGGPVDFAVAVTSMPERVTRLATSRVVNQTVTSGVN